MDDLGKGGWKLDANIRSELLSAVRPSDEERKKVTEAAERLRETVMAELDRLGASDVEVVLAGSVAKGTMTKRPDIDLFMIFPLNTEKDQLERTGLEVGSEVLIDPKKKYTQHPYMTGHYDGFRADIVPCLDIEPGENVATAVDRTPHHTEYINSKLMENQKEEVILLKSFLKGIGAYGAEGTVSGCSGYLTELLVLLNDDLSGALQYLSDLDVSVDVPGGCEEVDPVDVKGQGHMDVVLFEERALLFEKPLDREEYEIMFRNEPWVVVDPVDPERNVASPVSLKTLSYMVKAARALIRKPSKEFFHPFSSRPYSLEKLKAPVHQRAHSIEKGKYCIVPIFSLQLPDEDPQVVSTQLRSSLNKILSAMIRTGFEKVRARFLIVFPAGSDIDEGYLRTRWTWSGDVKEPMVFISTLAVPEALDPAYLHWGPPLENKRAADFRARWKERAEVDESEGRLFVIVEREFTDPADIFFSKWSDMKHGSSLRESELFRVEKGISNDEIWKVLTGGFDPWV